VYLILYLDDDAMKEKRETEVNIHPSKEKGILNLYLLLSSLIYTFLSYSEK